MHLKLDSQFFKHLAPARRAAGQPQRTPKLHEAAFPMMLPGRPPSKLAWGLEIHCRAADSAEARTRSTRCTTAAVLISRMSRSPRRPSLKLMDVPSAGENPRTTDCGNPYGPTSAGSVGPN